MKLNNLRNLDQDLNRGIEYNRKHGGVSDKLKEMAKRPESFRNGEGSGLIHTFENSLPSNKCKCGEIKFEYQEVCYKCNSKKYEKLQRKKV